MIEQDIVLASWRQKYWAVKSFYRLTCQAVGIFSPHTVVCPSQRVLRFSWVSILLIKHSQSVDIPSLINKFVVQGHYGDFHSVLRWNRTLLVEHLYKLRLGTDVFIFPAQRARWDLCNLLPMIYRKACTWGKPGWTESRLGRWVSKVLERPWLFINWMASMFLCLKWYLFPYVPCGLKTLWPMSSILLLVIAGGRLMPIVFDTKYYETRKLQFSGS